MNTKQYLENKPPDWVATEMLSFRFKRLIAEYNRKRLRNDTMKFSKEEWLELAKVHRPKFAKEHPMSAIRKTKNLIQREEVRIYADSLLAEALTKNKIDVNYVIESRKNILDKAIENKQLNVANQTLDVIEDYMGMKRIITRGSDTIESEETREIDYIKLDEEVRKKELPNGQKELPPSDTEHTAE